MKFKRVLLAFLFAGSIFGGFSARARNVYSVLNGIWHVSSASCASGKPISKKMAPFIHSLVIKFEHRHVGEIFNSGICRYISMGPYRVRDRHLLIGAGYSRTNCRGLPILRSKMPASIERFSLEHGRLKIREPGLGFICPSKRDAVIYTFYKVSMI